MAPSLATRKHSRPGRTDKRASAVCFCCGFVPVRQNNKEKTLFRRSVWVSDVVDVYRKKRERREIARAHRDARCLPGKAAAHQNRAHLFSLAKKKKKKKKKTFDARTRCASNEKTSSKTSSPPNCSRSTLSTRASRTQTTLMMTSFPVWRHVLLYLQSFHHRSSLKRRRKRRPGRRPRTKPPQKHRRTPLLLRIFCACEPHCEPKTHAPSGFCDDAFY